LIGAAVFGGQQFAYEIPKESAIFGAGGKTAPGAAIGKRKGGTFRSPKYYVKVSYVDDSKQAHETECKVSRGEYDAFEPETPLEVRYHPSDPSYAILAGSSYDHPPNPMVAGVVTGGLALLGVGALVIGKRSAG
jgi:hypothetical protein